MKLKSPTPLIRAILIAAIVGIVGWIGLDVPESAIEETVDQQLESFREVTANDSVPEAVAGGKRATVRQVIDGDTVIVDQVGERLTVRLIGIDTPEVAGSPAGAECFGAEATRYAKGLLENNTINLTTDATQAEYDQHDRLLAYIQLPEGGDFGEIMTREGYAREYTYNEPYVKQTEYQTAEAEARQFGRGLWSACE